MRMVLNLPFEISKMIVQYVNFLSVIALGLFHPLTHTKKKNKSEKKRRRKKKKEKKKEKKKHKTLQTTGVK